jgi:hypothetical protein
MVAALILSVDALIVLFLYAMTASSGLTVILGQATR